MPRIEEDERQKIGVPGGIEGDDGEGRHSGTGERQGDLQEGTDMPGAIDAGCVKEFLRHLLEELPHQKDAECANQPRQYDGERVVDQAQITHEQENGNDRHLKGHHQGSEQQQEEQVAPGKAQAGKRITGEGAGEKLAERYSHGNSHTIEEEVYEGHARFERREIIFPAEFRWQPGWRQMEALVRGAQRRGKHPGQRH